LCSGFFRDSKYVHCSQLRGKCWEVIAANLKKRGGSFGYALAIDSRGQTIWIANAHRDGQRFVVHADEKLVSFVELESAICAKRASFTAATTHHRGS
jgi:hypothetical protein